MADKQLIQSIQHINQLECDLGCKFVNSQQYIIQQANKYITSDCNQYNNNNHNNNNNNTKIKELINILCELSYSLLSSTVMNNHNHSIDDTMKLNHLLQQIQLTDNVDAIDTKQFNMLTRNTLQAIKNKIN